LQIGDLEGDEWKKRSIEVVEGNASIELTLFNECAVTVPFTVGDRVEIHDAKIAHFHEEVKMGATGGTTFRVSCKYCQLCTHYK
jgi:hypothetical protein